MFKKVLIVLRGIIYYFFYYIPRSVKLFFVRKDLVVKGININGTSYKLEVDLRDKGLSYDIYYDGFREMPNSKFLLKYLADYNITTSVDVGANIGYYAYMVKSLLEHKYPLTKSRLFAFEPSKENFSILKDNSKINKLSNVKLINSALGDRDGLVELVVPDKRNLSHIADISDVSGVKNPKVYKVPINTLETAFKVNRIPKSNLLFRWDVEGYEYNLIKGNMSFIKTLKNVHIVMEFHPFFFTPTQIVEFFDYLDVGGFTLVKVISCYPNYFLRVPVFLRKFLIWSWSAEKGGQSPGFLKGYRSIASAKEELKNPKSTLYSQPNLHLYFHKE